MAEQQSRQVGLSFRGNHLIAAYHNAVLDPAIAFTPKVWDRKRGMNGDPNVRVTLYNYVLSRGNPNAKALAYENAPHQAGIDPAPPRDCPL